MDPASSPPPTTRNWVFHTLAKADDPPRWRASALDVERFSALVEGEIAAGRRPTSLDHYASEPPHGDTFSVSFDDGHPSILHLAAPVLARLGVPATLFVPARFPGQTPYVMEWSDLRTLQDRYGWSIEAHGAQHQRASWRLYDESPAQHEDRLRRDYAEAIAVLRDKLGRCPQLLAYPFGDAPAIAQAAARAAGFQAAFAVAQEWAWDGNRFAIPRVDGQCYGQPRLDPDAPPAISVVVPACDRLSLLDEVVRRLLQQTYPRDHYEVIIVDDGSNPDLASIYADRDPLLRVIRVPASNRDTFRAGCARQFGADAARFDLLAFLDSDVAVDGDFLWHLAWIHARQEDAVGLGYLSGYNLVDLGYRHDLDRLRATPRLTGDQLPIIPDRSRETELACCLDDLSGLQAPWRLAYTGNLSVSRALLQRAGGFSRAFTGWGLEDTELGFRLHSAGAQWVFSRWAVGYHLYDPAEEVPGSAPRNPFRARSLATADFGPIERNLELFWAIHSDNTEVAQFCCELRDSIAEIQSRPGLVWVECGGPEPDGWPLPDMWRRHPGGLALECILDRVIYAERIGASEVRLIGGDPSLRPDLEAAFAVARRTGSLRVSVEITLDGALQAESAKRLQHWRPDSLFLLVPPGRPEGQVDAALSVLAALKLEVAAVRRLG
jgi:GT2 family glycosyltransferase